MNAHKKLTDEQGRGNERLLYWKKLKRGTPIFSWFPLEMTSVRGQRAAIELKMKDKIQTKVQLKPFNLSLKCMVFENASKSLTSSKGFHFKNFEFSRQKPILKPTGVILVRKFKYLKHETFRAIFKHCEL